MLDLSHSLAVLVCLLASTHAQAPEWLATAQRGAAQQSAGRWAESVSSYRSAIASGLPAEHQFTVAINLGLALQNTGALDEALNLYDRVLRVLRAIYTRRRAM